MKALTAYLYFLNGKIESLKKANLKLKVRNTILEHKIQNMEDELSVRKMSIPEGKEVFND